VPTYDYRCRSCGTTYEVIHSMLEDGPTTCERCGGELRRILYPTGIIFKGSGFYKTDARTSSASRGSASGASPADGKPADNASASSSGSEATPASKDKSSGSDKASSAAGSSSAE
jgi:putative FmdB family regulatory protein